ncbi:glycerophosphodiester phosphodiesterase [Jiangella anatolica]|uniref:Hydrolase n=1 Tax=Jiangella anatolica TaxID=2670374 RepID=A0A2W2B042_9ACTN|nr:glycerophosphodiester phosphodiesterase family protein [Jiangella anatolica]PZF80771.1 hydrolase [Jiangella anatolica]
MPKTLLKRALVVSALAAVGATGIVAPAQASGYHDEPDNIAHHGASGEAPENTLRAIRRAFNQGADAVEIEIQRTADGVLVALQDRSLARTTNVEEVFPDRAPWDVDTFTAAEIRQLDAGSWFDPRLAGQRVPTLDQVIDEVGAYRGLVVDLSAAFVHPGIEQDLAEELLDHSWYLNCVQRNGNLLVQSTDSGVVSGFHDLLPGVRVGVIHEFRPADETLVENAATLDRVDVEARWTDQALVDRAHELGLELVVHTVDTSDRMTFFAGLGVDGIATSLPRLLDQVVD